MQVGRHSKSRYSPIKRESDAIAVQSVDYWQSKHSNLDAFSHCLSRCPSPAPFQDLRNMVLSTENALNGLLLNVKQPYSRSLLRNCVWALSNMCRGKPQPETKTLAPIFPVFPALLGSPDENVRVICGGIV